MWIEQRNQLIRQFSFIDFQEAIAFLVRVAFIAEAQNHHPEIYNLYNQVELRLCTHDAGNIVTDKDWAFAKSINKLL